ncbi:hypothetical protein ACIBAC_00360 [Streptomyces sp. NPDC051362]|uniref:hypothetical protein n=1 Tax=Streptomyces sp. NPDC051362 TaxID=3365651 RepID=UPI003796F953
MDETYVIDLDAERREVQYPDGIPVKFHGEQLLFPAELPADALDPILSEELGLVSLLADVIEASEGEAGITEVVTALFRRPSLPMKFLEAVRASYKVLLGKEQYGEFIANRPSIGDYVRLTIGLTRVYGVELGKLFRSAVSSESDGVTSSPTSADSTESTPDASGSAQDSPDSSESDG